ncbi:unnamed protein product [Cylicocyclus nassatus]|uniref:Uncharacterized protein n=1 Tax=Cylicocyclus nassatus TaxID=53992 RepID=A0AA36DTY1_CYLNA|nr:unnamed protein product [Cylicocyclus nassatus]
MTDIFQLLPISHGAGGYWCAGQNWEHHIKKAFQKYCGCVELNLEYHSWIEEYLIAFSKGKKRSDKDLSTDSLEFRYTQKVLAFNFVSHSYGLMKGWMSISAFEQRRAQKPLM